MVPLVSVPTLRGSLGCRDPTKNRLVFFPGEEENQVDWQERVSGSIPLETQIHLSRTEGQPNIHRLSNLTFGLGVVRRSYPFRLPLEITGSPFFLDFSLLLYLS